MKHHWLWGLLLTAGAAFGQATFTNPLLPAGADPWAIHRNGVYYYTHTTGRNLTLRKTTDLSQLATAQTRVVWTPPAEGPFSRQIWAPELHFLQNKWYLYFAADDGRNRNHRLFVLENPAADPLTGTWTMKGELELPNDRWAIDGSVFEHAGRLYLLWSGWPGTENGLQSLYLCQLTSPWQAGPVRTLISSPTLDWERHGTIERPGPDDKPQVYVNEGPQLLKAPNGRLHVVYSASGCWTDHYTLGLLSAEPGADLLDPASWKKHPEPVFRAEKPVNGTYAAGHNSFFKSPDGSQDWILYHANTEAGQGCGGHRSPRMQPFTWTPDGLPVFGQPVAAGTPLQKPR